MEITKSSPVPLENQSSQTSQTININSVPKTTHDVEVQTVNENEDYTAPVNKFESKQRRILKIARVYKNVKKTQDSNDVDKQLKKTKRLKNINTSECPKTSVKKDKTSKTGSVGKKAISKSPKAVEAVGNEQHASEKHTTSKEQNENKIPALKKSPNDKHKFMSKPTKELLLSDYVTLSRDWTANRKTYTRSHVAVSVKAANEYDALTQKSEKMCSEHATESDSAPTETDPPKKHGGDKSSRQQLLDSGTNDRIDKVGGDVPTSATVERIVNIEKNSSELSEENSVLSESNSDNLLELPVLHSSAKTTILKQNKTKGKRKSVHFSDKIDLPIDCLNRNDILLEIDDVTAKSHKEEHLSDISLNNAVNAPLGIGTVPCITKEHPIQNKNISSSTHKTLDNLSNVSADDALIASIEIDKIQCPVKESQNYKKNLLKAKNQEGSLNCVSDNSASDATGASIKMVQIHHQALSKSKTYTKIVQKKSNKKGSVVTSGDKGRHDTIKENIIKKKRGRPRKVDVVAGHKNATVLKTKIFTKNKITEVQKRNLKSPLLTIADSENEGEKRAVLSKTICKRRPRKMLFAAAQQLQRQDKSKESSPVKGDRKQNFSVAACTETATSQQVVKRKRGRPRKCPLEHDDTCDVSSPSTKRMKLDQIEVATNSEKEGNEKDTSGTTANSTSNKENEKVILADALTSKSRAVQQVKCSQDVSRNAIAVEVIMPKVLTSSGNADAQKQRVLEELPLELKNSGENGTTVHCGKESQNVEIHNEIASNRQSKKDNNEQIVENGFPAANEVVSEPTVERQEAQMEEVKNSVSEKMLICSGKSGSNDANEMVKSNSEHADIVTCPDGNSFNDKFKEQEVQCTEMLGITVSEISVGSNEDKTADGSSPHKTYNRQRLKDTAKVVESSDAISIVNTDEGKYPNQEANNIESVEMNDLETQHGPNNHDVGTSESKKRQKKYKRTSNSTDLALSETICDRDQASDLRTERKYRSKRKKTANVKLLLKKLRPVSRKTKRKKITCSKSDSNKNAVAKDQNIMRTLVCGVCRQVYDSFREINHHIMSFHNGLARINDDTPFSAEEEISAFTQTLKKMKKLQCQQPGCGKKFISVAGYKYHREICGVEVPKVTCEICRRIVKAANLENHIRHSHADNDQDRQNVVEENGEGKEDTEVIPEELPRRGAAVKALKKMENFIKTQKFSLEENELEKLGDEDDDSVADSDYQESDFSEDDEDDYEKPEFFCVEMLNPWKGNIKTPADMAEEIYKEMEVSWEQILSENGKLKCDRKNCSKEFVTLSEMKAHLQHCMAKNWICNLCNKSYFQGLYLFNHMKRYHRIEDTGKSSGDVPRRSSYSYISNIINTSSDHGGNKLLKPYLPAIEWNMEFRKKHHKNELFSQWKPVSANWIQMKTQHLSDYLPPLKESAFVKSLEENSPGWTRLGLFECPKWADKERQKTFFVGGPVWGSAWCPTGTTSKAVQFLALAANNPAPHRLTDCSSQKGLIQLWDMGILETKSSSTPKLSLGIAHESGSIWDMEWCPSGCWEEALDVQNEKKSDSILPRLGLLAVACSNSTVRIYSVPHPYSIVTTKEKFPIFRSRPVVVLLCPDSAPNITCQRTLCTKVSWQKTNGHSHLAAGFGNGLVCLWNLVSSSPLLIVSQFGGQLSLRPYLSFPAHGACITGLVWIPVSDGQYLSTASYDRSVKVWNLEDHNWPSVVTKRGLITDITWLPYWCGVFASLEDCYNIQHTSTFYKECGYYSFGPKALSTHYGCIWSLSVSDWLNVEASGDASGEVIATVLCQLMKLVDGIKLMSHRRVPLFRISMKTLDKSCENEKQAESTQEILTEKNRENVDSSRKETREKPVQQRSSQKDHSGTNVDITTYHTYEEAVEKFGLVIQDNNMENFSAIPEKEFKRVRQQEMTSSYAVDEYPLNSINKVLWNPNLGSHLWLFSAGQAGIARVCCVFGLQSDNLRNTVNKCKEKFRTAANEL